MTAIVPDGWRVLSVAVGMTLAAPVFAGQLSQGCAVSPAPVPAQILSGKRVFVSNAGGENLSVLFGPVFSGPPDRVYNQFYAAMKDWGRYELVSAPAAADLVFEIGFTFNGNGLKVPEIGRLRLEIRDPRSNVLLWAFTDYVQVAILKGNRDKNLDQAMGVIVDGVKGLAIPPAATAKP